MDTGSKRAASPLFIRPIANTSSNRSILTIPLLTFFAVPIWVIFDAMYSLADSISIKEDWGHSSNIIGVELAQMAGAKHLCMYHHEPNYDDAMISRILAGNHSIRGTERRRANHCMSHRPMTVGKSCSRRQSVGRLKLNSFSALFHWRGRTLAFLCLAVFIVIRATNPEPLESLRTALFDTLQVMKPHIRHPDVPVVIVDIDEESLAHYGQWPWPRNLVAELVDRIAAHNPPAIGFDILFSEPDRLSPHHILTDYPELHPRAKQAIANLERTDARLARSLSAAPTVLGVGALLYRPTVRSRLVTQVPVLQRGGDATPKLPYFPTALQSLPQLGKAATSHGILNVLPEADGIIRRVPLVVNIDGTITPTLTVEMLRTAIGAPNYTIHFDGDRITGISIDSIFIPTEPDGRIWVNYTTHKKERYVSASDILDGNPAALNQIQGKLVLLGSTALGLVDEKSIPVEARINGIEIHAMLLESLITSELLTRPAIR